MSRLFRSNRWVSPAVGLVAVMVSGGGCAHHRHHHNDDNEDLKFGELPQQVQSNFHRDHDDARVMEIERESQDGVVHFEISYKDRNGDEHSTEYNREGDEVKLDK